MSVFTGISITLAAILLASLLWVLAEDRDEAEKADRAAAEERYRRFREAQADMQLMRDTSDQTFDFAVNYGRTLHYPEDFGRSDEK